MSDDDYSKSSNIPDDVQITQALIGTGVVILLVSGGALIFSQSCNSLSSTCNYETLKQIDLIKSVLPYLFGLGGVSLLAGFIKANGDSNKRISTTSIPYNTSKDSTDALHDLKKLYDNGIITAEEYEEKRKKLLKNI